MRALQRLVKNGNSTAVSIPRPMLIHLAWLAGQDVIVEVLDDNSLHIRRPVEEDFGVRGASRMLFNTIGLNK